MAQTGVVKWFDSKKGFGFLLREGKPDLFVHFSGIVGEGFRTLYQNDKVSYDVVEGAKGGDLAVNVTVIERAKRKHPSKGKQEATDVEE